MNIVDLIDKKVNGENYSKNELEFIIRDYVSGKIKDYQMASWLMSIRLLGMNEQEIADLTLAMMNSGEIINLDDIEGIKVDKHSTGGVGDKVSLILAPILAANGVKVAKMSGRGLGHTGGTIDKLESIPGFKTEISQKDFIKQVSEINLAIIGQSPLLVPADKKIYALRDVTATVASIPLIASSIMSKKLATGANAILLDVKVGKGAFMKNIEDAEQLAKAMISIGKLLNRDVRVELTNMDRPLGKTIGNKNEVLEAIATLNGDGAKDLNTIIYSSAATLLVMANKTKSHSDGIAMVQKVISNKSALHFFQKMVEAQGGNYQAIIDENFWKPKYKIDIKADEAGYFVVDDALTFGLAAVDLGAGRHNKDDKIDNDAGINFAIQTNDMVRKDDLLFTLYSSNKIEQNIVDKLKTGYHISKIAVPNLIILKQIN